LFQFRGTFHRQKEGNSTDKDEINKEILNLRKQGLSYREIADKLREKGIDLSATTVRRYYLDAIAKAKIVVNSLAKAWEERNKEKNQKVETANPQTVKTAINQTDEKISHNEITPGTAPSQDNSPINLDSQSTTLRTPNTKKKYPGYEDEDLLGIENRKYVEMTPWERYEYVQYLSTKYPGLDSLPPKERYKRILDHEEKVRQEKKQRRTEKLDRIGYFALLILLLSPFIWWKHTEIISFIHVLIRFLGY